MNYFKVLNRALLTLLITVFLFGLGQPMASAAANTAKVPAPSNTIEVKFSESAQVVLQNNQFLSQTKQNISSVNLSLNKHKVLSKRTLLNENIQTIRQRQNLKRSQGVATPDLSGYYRITLQPGENAKSVAQSLKGLSGVDESYVLPTPAPSPTTPDFSSQQMYMNAAPAFMGINAAKGLPAVYGANVKVADLEYSWNVNHEDLAKDRATGALWAVGTPYDPFNDNNHGTAVSGVLVATRNGYGVNGIVSNTDFHMVNTDSSEYGWNIASAIYTATTNMTAGDVILIEQQTYGPDGSTLLPSEWIPSVYDAIKSATASGIVVVEAAGNGSANLNDPTYGTTFPSGKTDSGAIMVGAGSACGTSPTHYRLSYSNYGSRVNVQGNGECVVTTGVGDLFGSNATNNSYYSNFNGTSSASALVAATAAAVSSSYESIYKKPATPAIVRNALKNTGTAQDTSVAGNIGPLPNLVASIKSLDTIKPSTPTSFTVKLNTSNQPLLKWVTSTDNSSIAHYKIFRNGVLISTTGVVTSFTDTTAKAKTTYGYQVQAVDMVGNVSAKTVKINVTTK